MFEISAAPQVLILLSDSKVDSYSKSYFPQQLFEENLDKVNRKREKYSCVQYKIIFINVFFSIMTKSYHNFYSCKKYEVYNKFCDDSNNHCFY